MSYRLPAILVLLSTPALAQTGPAPAPSAAAPAPAPDKSGYTLFDPTPDTALRGFNTDRPTRSNSPVTVDAGHFQYETDLFNYTHSNVGGVSTRLYTVLDPVLKLGLTDRLDLELQFNGYNRSTVVDPGTGTRLSSVDGAGDLVVRAKLNLFGNEGGPAAALIPYVKVPSASRGIGNGVTEGGLIGPITVPLPWDFTVLVMPEVDVLKNAADPGHHFSFTQLLNLSHPIGSKITAYAELYSAIGADHRTPPVYTFDAALSYALGANAEVDVGTNIGLNRAAPNLQLYTGVAQRF